MRRILLSLALVGLVGCFTTPTDVSAAQARTARSVESSKPVRMVRKTHPNRSVHKIQPVRSNHKIHTKHSVHKSRKARSQPAAKPTHASRANRSNRSIHTVSHSGPARRYFGTRLYYSNAFRGMIPGTGYGGFRRPAFGNRGY